MKHYLGVLCLSFFSLCSWAESDAAMDELLASLQGITQLQGRFEQRQYGQQDVLLVESSGSFRLLRPGYFAWQIESPDSQLIIATPQYIWHHDRDLETVTRRPVTDSAQMSPLQVLGGDEDILRQRFEVQGAGQGAFVLIPRSEQVGFRRLTLQLDGSQISSMDIVDQLGQRIVIKLLQQDSQSILSSADFDFSPPDGADLFYYDE